MCFPHLLMVTDEDEVLAFPAQRGDGVSLENFRSLLDDHQAGLQLLQDFPVFGCSRGRHPNDLSGTTCSFFFPGARMWRTLGDSPHPVSRQHAMWSLAANCFYLGFLKQEKVLAALNFRQSVHGVLVGLPTIFNDGARFHPVVANPRAADKGVN